MSKKEIIAPSTPVSVVSSLLNTLTPAAEIGREEGGFVSLYMNRFAVFYPIQATGSGKEKPWHAYISNGKVSNFLTTPYSLICLGTRKAVRMLDPEDDTKYIRSYADAKSQGGKARLEEIVESGEAQEGVMAVVAVLQGGRVSLATAELYKTHLSYWHPPLAACDLKAKKVVEVQITDHSENLVISKGGKKYLSAAAFVQWSVKEATDEEIALVLSEIENQKTAIKGFLAE